MAYLLKCKHCGKEFRSSSKTTRFCCQECKDEYNKLLYKETRICPQCGKEFIVNKSAKQRYCCAECSFKAKDTSVLKVCKYCGKEFRVMKCKINTACYCSNECKFADIRAKHNTTCTTCGKPTYKNLEK